MHAIIVVPFLLLLGSIAIIVGTTEALLGVPDVSLVLDTGQGGCSGTQEALLEIYLPPPSSSSEASSSPVPAVLVVPGGAYRKHSSAAALQAGNDYSSDGFVVGILYYRLPRSDAKGDPVVCSNASESIDDVKAAMEHLATNAEHYGIDGLKIVLSGLSAGGHLAALYGTTCRLSTPNNSSSSSSSICPSAMVLYYPWMVPGSKIHCAEVGTEYWGAVYDDCFPTNLVGPDTPPTVLYYAMGDTVVPETDMDDFSNALALQGVAHIYLKVPSAVGHVLLPFEEVAAASSNNGALVLAPDGNYGQLVEQALLLGCSPCDDVATDWMIDNDKTCAQRVKGAQPGAVCASNANWSQQKFCQTSCYENGQGYAGDVCCPPAPPSCIDCDNVGTDWMIDNDKTCAQRVEEKAASVCNSNANWSQHKFCQTSCYQSGQGYDGDVCC